MKIFKDIANGVLDTLFPRTCPVCEKVLSSHEQHLCTKCLLGIPRTRFHETAFNPMEQLFAGKVLIEHASGFFFYEKGNPYSNILHRIKYGNSPQLGRFMAGLYARELVTHSILTTVDCILPVPLHHTKKARRGYNQSEFIARGFADVFNVPVYTDVIEAVREHASQTHKGIYERWLNTQGVFEASCTETIENKHVLIVDDVVTTGATLLSAVQSIAGVQGIKISLATLGVARLD